MSARPDRIEADALQSRVFDTRANSVPASGAPRATFSNERTSLSARACSMRCTHLDVGIFLREFRFGAVILVVMTMIAPAALL
jgi:hypothetical protein